MGPRCEQSDVLPFQSTACRRKRMTERSLGGKGMGWLRALLTRRVISEYASLANFAKKVKMGC